MIKLFSAVILFLVIFFASFPAFAEEPFRAILIKPTLVNSHLVQNHKTVYRVEFLDRKNGCIRNRVEPGQGVTLVLSGGISKGLAIIGALKLLDQAGIRIDGIVGTSMGALIGAFYATGYSPDEIEGVVKQSIDWSTVFTDLPSGESLDENLLGLWGISDKNNLIPRINQQGIKTGQNVYSLLNRYFLPGMAASGNCFSNLYIPLVVIGTDVSRFEEKSFKEGSLVNALRASMSFPVIFTPTYIDGVKYRDGGIANNFPIDVAQREFNSGLLIGLDVTDKTNALLNAQPLFPFLSAYQITIDTIDSLSTPIILKTKKEIETKGNCFSPPEKSRSGQNPCNLIIQLELHGGFSDFKAETIQKFIDSGYLQTQNEICQFILENREIPENCGNNPEELGKSLMNVLKNLIPEKKDVLLDEKIKKKLHLLRNGLEKGLFSRKERTGHSDGGSGNGENKLLGIEIRFRPEEEEIQLLADRHLPGDEVDALVRSAKLLIDELITHDGKIETYSGAPFSSAAFRLEEEGIDGEIFSWSFHFDRFEFRSNLTEKGGLENASVFLKGYEEEEIIRSLEKLKQGFLCSPLENDCQKEVFLEGIKPGKFAKIEINEKWPENTVRLNPDYAIPFWHSDDWKNHFFKRVHPLSGKTSIMDLTGKLDQTINQYYAMGKTEYVRLEKIERDGLVLDEKKNSPPWWGWWYFNYQFDNENAHNYVLKGYQSREKLSLAFDGALLNYFKEGADDGKYLEMSLLWLNFQDYVNNFKINYRLSKRIQNILYQPDANSSENLQMLYDEWGVKLTLPIGPLTWGMSGEEKKETSELRVAHDLSQSGSPAYVLGIKTEYYETKNLRFNNNPSGAAFASANLISAQSEQFLKVLLDYGYYNYLFGKKVFFLTDLGGGTAQFSNEFLWSFQQSLASRNRIGGKYPVEVKYTLGRNKEKITGFPINEFYSIGGYFPLMENRFWREKRFDFIGSGMNEKWGENLSLAEIKIGVPISSFNELQIINPMVELQANTIIDYGGTSNAPGILTDNAEMGWGESFSLFFPVLATIEGNLNFNIGTKGKGCLESTQTCNIRIYFATEITF